MYDIAIIGAGASGLLAALTLSQSKKVCVIEADERVGGRAHTRYGLFSTAIETGAEFVHGNLPVTLSLLKKFKIKYFKVGGDIWEKRNGHFKKDDEFIENPEVIIQKLRELKQDISVAAFLDMYFKDKQYDELVKSICRYTEGFNAADVSRASSFFLLNQLREEEEVQYRIDGGYGRLISAMHERCISQHCDFYLSSAVQTIRWAENEVKIATLNDKTFEAKQVLITVPCAVLQKDDEGKRGIQFMPAIQAKMEAIDAMGCGMVIKVLLEFSIPFWKLPQIREKPGANLGEFFFLFSEEAIPTWWTQRPVENNILTGWLAGPKALSLKNRSSAEILELSLQSLSNLFEVPVSMLISQLKKHHIENWSTHPFAKQAYNYVTPQTKAAVKILAEPVMNTLFFAGETLYDDSAAGTVEAAFVSSVLATDRLLGTAQNKM
ncbi:MAG: puo 1 [Bacteroidota bacterium]|nr:puo 1 [Bacteroidota bacterium]